MDGRGGNDQTVIQIARAEASRSTPEERGLCQSRIGIMSDLHQLFQVLLDTFTLFILLVGLVGLVMPVFPGLTTMWLGTLAYALIQNAAGNMTTWHWVAFAIITLLMIAG